MDATHDEAKDRTRRSGAGLAVVLLAAAALLYVVMNREGQGPAVEDHPAIGRRLQFLRLEPLTGDAQAVSIDDLQGCVTLVNYWGTWCPPCIREFPDLLALSNRFGSHEDFRFYPVSCGQDGDADLSALRAVTEDFLKSHSTGGLATYADQNAASRRAMLVELDMPPGSFAYPTTILFDRHGAIRGLWQGYSPRAVHEMARKVEELLATK